MLYRKQTLDTEFRLGDRVAGPIGTHACVIARMAALHALNIQRAAAPAVHQNADTRQLPSRLPIVVPCYVEGGISVYHGASHLIVVAHIKRRIIWKWRQFWWHFGAKLKEIIIK